MRSDLCIARLPLCRRSSTTCMRRGQPSGSHRGATARPRRGEITARSYLHAAALLRGVLGGLAADVGTRCLNGVVNESALLLLALVDLLEGRLRLRHLLSGEVRLG